VRIVDNDGVYIGDVHSAFDDVGTNEHIVFLVDKIEYPFFELMAF
jgi:hypothetical protein